MITKTINLRSGSINEKRKEILDYFQFTFLQYQSLFECILDEGFYARANRLRHPLIFYYGHTAVFFINKLNVSNFTSTRINEKLETTLAIGVDEMSWDDLSTQNYNWPSIKEVKEYR